MQPGERKYMQRALELARHAEGVSLPNPMVGAVIVAPDGRIIGEGFTDVVGRGHAEVNAVRSVAEADRKLLPQSTVYVTLEPCSHYGHTPPCAKMLCDIGVRRVVVGTVDSFAKVSGRGIDMLRRGGIEVEMAPDDIARECQWLNRRFFTAHRQQRPYITLKWARSADGWLDRRRSSEHGGPAALSTAVSRVAVHRLRAENDAILVGSGTVLADCPRLDCRLAGGKDPQPVIIDARRRLQPTDISTVRQPMILDYEAPTAEYMAELYRRGITSVLVEGGSDTLQRFIDAGLWDEAREEISPCRLGDEGCAPAPRMPVGPVDCSQIGPNIINRYVKNGTMRVKNL